MRIEHLSPWQIVGATTYGIIGFFVFGFVLRDSFVKGRYLLIRLIGSMVFSTIFGIAWIIAVPITLGFVVAIRYSDPIRPPRSIE